MWENRSMENELAVAPATGTLAERIKQLLGQNIPGSMVASAVGCDPSYVSQLMEDENFKREVLTLRAERAEGAVKRDNSWDNVEQMALDKATQMLPLVSRPSDLIRIAAMANAAKRRSAEYGGAGENSAPTVTLSLPASATVHLQMNIQSQVVEIDGRSLAALPTKHLVEKLKERREARNQQGEIVDVKMPQLSAPVPTVVSTERKKVESILERIGYADEPVPVPKLL